MFDRAANAMYTFYLLAQWKSWNKSQGRDEISLINGQLIDALIAWTRRWYKSVQSLYSDDSWILRIAAERRHTWNASSRDDRRRTGRRAFHGRVGGIYWTDDSSCRIDWRTAGWHRLLLLSLSAVNQIKSVRSRDFPPNGNAWWVSLCVCVLSWYQNKAATKIPCIFHRKWRIVFTTDKNRNFSSKFAISIAILSQHNWFYYLWYNGNILIKFF